MHVRKRRGWELPGGAATPEAVFQERRRLLAALGLGVLGAGLRVRAETPAAPAWQAAEAEPPPAPRVIRFGRVRR